MVLEDFDDFQTKSPSPRAICRRPCIWKEIWRCVAWSLEQTYVTETTSAPQIQAWLTIALCLLSTGPPGPWRPPSLEEAVPAASALMESRRAELSMCFWFNVKTQGSKRPVAAAGITPASHRNASFLPTAGGC